MKPTRALALPALLILVACGGGGGGANAPTPPTQSGGSAQVQVRLAVPAQSNTASTLRRHAQFVAWTTAGILVSTYTSPRAQHPTPVMQTAFDVSATSTACSASATGRTCTLTLTLPATGTDDFVVASYDTAPAAGALPSTAKQLGIGISAGVTIATGTNAIAFSLNGVVASAALQVASPSFVQLTSGTQSVNVQALDADQNTIVTDAYSDAAGNPVSIALGVTGTGSAHFQIAPATISAPTPNGVTLTYTTGTLTAAEFAAGFAVTLTATPSSGGTTASPVAITVPAGNQTFTNGLEANPLPFEITVGPDQQIWFTDIQSSGLIGTITTTGTIHQFNTPTISSPIGIASGPDGNVWFTEQVANDIGTVNPATPNTGAVVEFPILTANSSPGGIVSGPDGNLWFTEGAGPANRIGRITTAGVITEFAIPTGSAGALFIAAGSDGALWFTENIKNKIGRITTAGVITEFTIPTANVAPYAIVAGPDGALWFTEQSAAAVGRVTTAGVFTQIDVSPAAFTTAITTGPDGNIWATSNGSIIRITPGGAVTVLPNFTANPTTGLTAGHDGNLWYAINGLGIGKITL